MKFSPQAQSVRAYAAQPCAENEHKVSVHQGDVIIGR